MNQANTRAASLPSRLRGRYLRDRERIRHRHRVDKRARSLIETAFAGGIVAIAVLALLARIRVGVDVGAVIVAALGVLLAIATTRRPAVPPHAHGLAGVLEPDQCPVPAPIDHQKRVIVVRGLFVLLALFLALGIPSYKGFLALVVVLSVSAPILLDFVRLWRARFAIRSALAKLQPRFFIGYGGKGGGTIHIGMWEPYLAASGERGAIVLLRSQYCAHLRNGVDTQMPWIQAGSDVLGDVQIITVPSVTSYFYVQNAPNHLKLMAMTSMRHIWLGHGDSDKDGSHHSRHGNYDILVAAGEAAIERYERHGVSIPREKFVLLGRPQSGEVLPATQSITEIERPTVLYAPTWVGNGKMTNFSSIKIAPQIVQAIVDAGANVIFRPHPVFLTGKKFEPVLAKIYAVMQKDAEREGSISQHVWGEQAESIWSVTECMNHADALVSDVSSVISDWLASDKPYVTISMHHELDSFVEAIPVAAGGYMVDKNLTGFGEVLDQMLRHDPMAQQRHELKVHVLGDYSGTESAQAFSVWVAETVRVPISR